MVVDTVCGSFEWIQGWGDLPSELEGCDVPGVAVSPSDQVFVLSRSKLPIVVLDTSGALVNAWGAGDFVRPHGVHSAPDGTVWCADDEGQRLLHYSANGELLETIQRENRASETGYVVGDVHSVRRSSPPFCYPTGIESGPDRDIWVTDGYGNARVHHFAANREVLASFGDPGQGPLEFVIPHGILRLPDGQLLVCDRENQRAQIIDPVGRMVGEWTGLHFPNNIATLDHSVYVVAELGNVVQGVAPEMRIVPDAPYARVTARDSRGMLLAEILPPPKAKVDIWFAPHGIAVDSRGDIYVGEVRAAYSRGLDGASRPCLSKLVLKASPKPWAVPGPAAPVKA